jgi:hypothetical protein
MAYENDPPELTGTGQKAEPKSLHRASTTQSPAPTTRASTSGRAKVPHPVTAAPDSRGSQRKAWEAASVETAAARVELIDATSAHLAAEHSEGAAVSAWAALNHPAPDAVVRDYLKREGELRAANVAAGLDPSNRGGPVQAASQWPIETMARNRGKGGAPLRSPVARRTV